MEWVYYIRPDRSSRDFLASRLIKLYELLKANETPFPYGSIIMEYRAIEYARFIL